MRVSDAQRISLLQADDRKGQLKQEPDGALTPAITRLLSPPIQWCRIRESPLGRLRYTPREV